MNARANLHKKWHRELKEFWLTNDMPTACEVCGATWPVALAHSKKRRMIQDRDDYFEVALLCQTCHEEVEFSGHENMERAIKEIIAARA